MRVLVCLTALLLAVPGCASERQEVAQSTEAPASPTVGASPDASPTPAATGAETAAPSPSAAATEAATEEPSEAETAPGREVELWFIRDTKTRPYLEPELHRLPRATQAVARATIELLIATEPDDPASVNAMPDGTRLIGVALADGLLTVNLDFPNDDPGLGLSYEGYLYGQITHTGAQFPSVKRVRVLEEGRTPPSGHFANLDKPNRPRENSISSVVILEPGHRQRVAGGSIAVRGTANVYEATVVLRLHDPAGKVVERTFATATCGTGCRGTWTHTFDDVTAPGIWTVVAAASDPSDGEGPPPYTVRRRFLVE